MDRCRCCTCGKDMTLAEVAAYGGRHCEDCAASVWNCYAHLSPGRINCKAGKYRMLPLHLPPGWSRVRGRLRRTKREQL